ncbi:MAG: hypothetical protein KC620_17585, partial [Myxococcales bacterium]|nr:hypothetical protein [Myxococcales bacterium]
MPPVLVVLIALAAPAADPPARAVIAQRAPTPAGPTGLDRIWSADLGPPGTYRLRFTLSHFETADFPLDGANDVFTATDFAFAATPLPFLEPFLALRGTSNANDGERPRVFQSLGDLTIGLKSGADVTPWLSLGGAATVRVVSALGGGGFDFDATSYELRALATFDALRGLDLPARFLIDLSYTFENSEALYAGLPQEPTVVQEFGLQAGRYDRFLIGLGLEVPFVEECSAYIEYRLGTPFQVELTRRGAGSDEFSFGALPHTFTPGLRAFPLPELAVDFAVRFGLSDAVYTGVPATPPWEMVIGLAYTLDPRPIVKTETVER